MAGVTIKELGLGFVRRCFEIYWGSCWYPLLFAVGLICTLIWGRKKKSRIFIGYTCFLALTVYNPLIVKYVIPKMNFENEYYRFIWILPVIPAVAYYGVRLITAFGKKWQKVLAAGIILGIFVAMGNPLNGVVTNFALAENLYKIPNDLRAICDVIHQNQEEEFPGVVFDASLNNRVRQYDAGIRVVISRNASIYRSGSSVAGSFDEKSTFYKRQKALLDVIDYHIYDRPKAFVRALEKTKTDFIVISMDAPDGEFLTEAGCELIAQTESHYIYKFNRNR